MLLVFTIKKKKNIYIKDIYLIKNLAKLQNFSSELSLQSIPK